MVMYIIATDDLALCHDRHGSECLRSMPRTKGAPSNVLAFTERGRAESELSALRDGNHWPLFAHDATVRGVEFR